MGPREERVREEMARAADTARGLGQILGLADMRHFADEIAYAQLEDAGGREEFAPSDASVEKMVDRRVQRRLRTDAAYLNAENAEEQSQREEEITRQVERELGVGGPDERYE